MKNKTDGEMSELSNLGLFKVIQMSVRSMHLCYHDNPIREIKLL